MPAPLPAHETLAADELGRYVEIVTKLYAIAPLVVIRWDLRGSAAVGRCRHDGDGRSLLRLNSWMASELGKADRETVAHYYAHAVVHWQRVQRTPRPGGGCWVSHGGMWKALMREFGYPYAQRCLNYRSAVSIAGAPGQAPEERLLFGPRFHGERFV